MNTVVAEQVTAELCRRGFDARLFSGPAADGMQRYRGVAIHGTCVLGWRYPDGRWEFTDRPPQLIQPDPGDPAGRWIWDDIFSESCWAMASASDPAHVIAQKVAQSLPTDPNRRRAQSFPDFWSWDQACLRSAEAPEQWYQKWCDHLFAELRPEAARAGYTPHTARLADYMCSPRALTAITSNSMDSARPQVYRLASDVPLAASLRNRLRNISIRTDFSTWAQIGHTCDPVDWPALVTELGAYLGWDYGRHGATGHTPLPTGSLPGDVYLRVGPDGRVLILPTSPPAPASANDNNTGEAL